MSAIIACSQILQFAKPCEWIKSESSQIFCKFGRLALICYFRYEDGMSLPWNGKSNSILTEIIWFVINESVNRPSRSEVKPSKRHKCCSPLCISSQNQSSNLLKVWVTSRTKSITPILTCELITPVSTLKFSHENFNMQIRLKLCQIWRVKKFSHLKFSGLKLSHLKQAWYFSYLNRPEFFHT